MTKISIALSALLAIFAISAQADVASAQKLADKYAGIAKSVNPSFAGLSAEEGKAFYNREVGVKGNKVSCATCHTANPADNGRDITTHKMIKPLSPVTNSKRFSDLDKVEEKFVEHCNDITGSDCAASDKANYIAYMITAKEKTPKANKK